jgi:hypothetical protein
LLGYIKSGEVFAGTVPSLHWINWGMLAITTADGILVHARERSITCHRTSRQSVLCILDEMEQRYDIRKKDLFEVLVDLMVNKNRIEINVI